MKVTKFVPGEIVTTLLDLVAFLEEGRWIYLWGRPKHPTILRGMTLNTLRGYVGRRSLALAEPNPERTDP